MEIVSVEIKHKYDVEVNDAVRITKLDRRFLGGLASGYFKKFNGKTARVEKICSNKTFGILVVPEGYKSGLFVRRDEVEKI